MAEENVRVLSNASSQAQAMDEVRVLSYASLNNFRQFSPAVKNHLKRVSCSEFVSWNARFSISLID